MFCVVKVVSSPVQSHARSRTEISARTGVQRGEQEPGNTQSAHSNMGRHEGAQGVTNWESQERGIAEIADEAVLVRRLARGAHGAASSEPPNARGSWDGACSGSSRSVLPRAASDAPTSTTTGRNRPRSSRRRSGVSLSGCSSRRSDIAANSRGCGSKSRLRSNLDGDVQKVAEEHGDQVNEELERSRSRDRGRRCGSSRRS